MWKQAYSMISNPNISTIWMAQFDEFDEGTAIMKVKHKSSSLPTNGQFLGLDADGYNNLPSDWYLRLTGEAQRMMSGQISLTSTIPLDPLDPPPATPNPTFQPTTSPSHAPSQHPTSSPTSHPSSAPSQGPTKVVSSRFPDTSCVSSMTTVFILCS